MFRIKPSGVDSIFTINNFYTASNARVCHFSPLILEGKCYLISSNKTAFLSNEMATHLHPVTDMAKWFYLEQCALI